MKKLLLLKNQGFKSMLLLGFLFMFSNYSWGQTTLLTENFSSATVPGLPTGWTATSGTYTWVSNNVNVSTGAYSGASGGNYLVVYNATTCTCSAVYDLTYNNSLSTVGYSSIKVSYGSRRSASTVSDAVLQYSINGSTWVTVVATSPTNTGGIWTLANGDRNSYELPAAAANVTNLQLRWKFTQSATASSANYSIDDVIVQGITSGQYWPEGDGDYRSAVASGTWSSSNTWQVRTSGVWATATTQPTAANNVYIQSGHAITVGANASCRDLNFNTTSTAAAITVNDGITLQVNRKIRAYTGTTTVTTGNDAAFYTTVSVTNGNPTIVTTGTGKISFVNPGPITYLGEWGANNTIWNAEFAIPVGQTASLGTNFKAGNINIVSGTLSATSYDLRPDNGSPGGGTLTVASGAKLLFNSGGNIQRIGSSATSHCSTVTINGILEYSGSNIGSIGATTINFIGEVIYSQNQQSLVTKGSNSGGTDPTTYNNLSFNGGSSTSVKTITLPTTVNGKLSFACHASHGITFSGTGALIYGPNATLEYAMTNTTRRVINPEWPATFGPKNVTIVSTNATCGLTLSSNVGGSTLNSLTVGLNTTLDAATNSITLNGTTPSVNVLGKFRTNNLNGLSGTSSSSILNTNSPTVTLGNASTIEYYAALGTTQTITNRSDYFNVSLSGSDNNKTFTGSTNIAGTLLLSITGTSTLTGMSNVTMGNNSTIIRNSGILDAAPIYGSDVTVKYGGTDYVNSGFELTPSAGTILALNITSGQYNLASNYTVNTEKTLTISETGTLGINSGKTLTVVGTADFGGKAVTIKSNSTGNGAIGQVTGNNLTGATNVTVERYIPAKRSWRAITAPVTMSTSINANWQEGSPVTGNGYGFDIWSNTGGTGIITEGSGSSLLAYDSTTNNTWSAITNTTTSSSMMDGSKNKPFMAFVTGPYGTNNVTAGATDTTLRATGTLLTGDQTYTTVANKYTFIGNPYASPLNISLMLADNTSFGTNIWVWDAKAAGTYSLGAYNTYESTTNSYTNITTATSGDSPLGTGTQIQSGQAFFVKSTTGGTFTIKETHKGTTFSNAVFRTAAPELFRVGLYKQVNNEWSGRDGAMTVILQDADANQTPNKMANGTENIAFTKNGANFASNHHLPLVATDVLNVKVWNTTPGANYKLKLNTEEFATTNLSATLEDLFTNARTPLALDGSAVEYPFTVTTDALSTGDRFRIVFQTSTLGTTIPTATGFSIVPNPVTGDSFQVNLSSLATGTYSYSICNAIGQEVEKGSINTTTQNTNYTVKFRETAATGIYIMKIKGSDNSVFTAKLIKK